MHCTRPNQPVHPHWLPSFASLRTSHPICLFPPFIPCVTHQPSTWLMSCHQPHPHSENSFLVPVLPHSSSRSSVQASHMERLLRVKCHDQAALHKSTSSEHRYSPKCTHGVSRHVAQRAFNRSNSPRKTHDSRRCIGKAVAGPERGWDKTAHMACLESPAHSA